MRRIAVVGLGYAGLPIAVAFARKFPGTIGYDVDSAKVARLSQGYDRTGETSREDLEGSGLVVTADPADIAEADFYVVCVPTPIDAGRRPDLGALRASSRTVGKVLKRGDVVVYQSTVYPGVTEDVCGPILEEASGLVCGVDFKLGYAPERINPGDVEHGFGRAIKVVSAQDEASLAAVEECYGAVVEAGLHRASSIRVAEAAKLIENVQRDLNIALMNEIAIVCDRMGIDTHDVLDAAATKWNFHRYHPGLVGGHCIGVDPYYLTAKAEELGLNPEVVLAGRRINDRMGEYVGRRTRALLAEVDRTREHARVAVLGVAFKADVADPRNSRVPDIVRVLREAGMQVLVHDPLVDPDEVRREAGLELVDAEELQGVDAVVLAMPHRGLPDLALSLVGEGKGRVLIDVMAGVDRARVPAGVRFWRL